MIDGTLRMADPLAPWRTDARYIGGKIFSPKTRDIVVASLTAPVNLQAHRGSEKNAKVSLRLGTTLSALGQNCFLRTISYHFYFYANTEKS